MDSNTPTQYFLRASQAAEMLGVSAQIIKMWCINIPEYINPRRTAGGHRLYSQEDIEKLKLLKLLLVDRQMSTKATKQYIQEVSKRLHPPRCKTAKDASNMLTKLKHSLTDNPKAQETLAAVIVWLNNTEICNQSKQ